MNEEIKKTADLNRKRQRAYREQHADDLRSARRVTYALMGLRRKRLSRWDNPERYRERALAKVADALFAFLTEKEVNAIIMYAQGQGVPQDDTEAAKWYRKAAEQGIAEVQYSLGQMYRRGQGVPQDNAEAVKWYRKAAEQGIAEAQYSLGQMYRRGQGVPQDNAEAAKWYRRAAEQGYASAQSNFGGMYFSGEGVKQDNVLAHMWVNLAVSRLPPSEKVNRERALKNMNIVASKMTPDQIAEAERLAREWKPKKERKYTGNKIREQRTGKGM